MTTKIVNPYHRPQLLAERRERDCREDRLMAIYSFVLAAVFLAIAIAGGFWIAHHVLLIYEWLKQKAGAL